MRAGDRNPLSKLASAMNRNAVTKGTGPYGANVTRSTGPAAPAKSSQSSQSMPPWFTPKPQMANQARASGPMPQPVPAPIPRRRRKKRSTAYQGPAEAPP